MPHYPRTTTGFTLLELMIVILVMSLVGGILLSVATVNTYIDNKQTNEKRLKVLEKALDDYRQKGWRLPCPADASLVETNANFGQEAATPGTCTGGTPAANFNNTGGDSNVVMGMVPVRKLGLPDRYAYDAWGRRIMYAVDKRMTDYCAFETYPISSASAGAITINDKNGNLKTDKAIYALLAHGLNGHGAYLPSGSRYDRDVTNTQELENCDCDDDAAATTFDSTFIQRSGKASTDKLDQFDDTLVYKTRMQMGSAYEMGFVNTAPLGCVEMVRLDGVTNSESGFSTASGDINGDGYSDLIIGVKNADNNGSNSGSTYVVFGKASGWVTPLNLSTLDGTNGFRLDGEAASDQNGWAVASGDINNDNFDDVIIGAKLTDFTAFAAGSTYVVFGKASGWNASDTLDATFRLNGTKGFRLDGEVLSDQTGSSLASGDINNDGFDDVIIGGFAADFSANASGSTYVVFGKASGWNASDTMNATFRLNGTKGFRLDGEAEIDQNGSFLASGDINNDGFDDIITAAAYADFNGSNSGSTYVVFGKASGWNASDTMNATFRLNATKGFRLDGEAGDDYSGISLASGDINGDTIDDIIIGAAGADFSASGSGSSYVIFGKASGWNASDTMNATFRLNGTKGFRLDGEVASDNSGREVASGDINNDGFDDIIIGASGADFNGNFSGAIYVIFGKASGWNASDTMNATFRLNGTKGFRLDGESQSYFSGYSVSAGDINNDNLSDIIIGAHGAIHNGVDSGSTYIHLSNTEDYPAARNLSGTGYRYQ